MFSITVEIRRTMAEPAEFVWPCLERARLLENCVKKRMTYATIATHQARRGDVRVHTCTGERVARPRTGMHQRRHYFGLLSAIDPSPYPVTVPTHSHAQQARNPPKPKTMSRLPLTMQPKWSFRAHTRAIQARHVEFRVYRF